MTTPSSSHPVSLRLSWWKRVVPVLGQEFAPRNLMLSANAALMVFSIEIITSISFSALIFSGSLSAFLPRAISYILIGAAILIATVSLFSSSGGAIAGTQDPASVILAVVAASIAGTWAAGMKGEALFATVLILIAGTTLAMGVTCLLLGLFKLGRFARFLPYPVVGGFLAGTGWLLVMGGINIATPVPPGLGLLQPDTLILWLPALAFGVIMLLVSRRWANPLVLIVLFLGALIAFYTITTALGISTSTLSAQGWLLGPFPENLPWHFPFDSNILSLVDWSALVGVIPMVAPAILISVLGLLLNSSSLELVTKQDIALEREMVVNGAANLAAGLMGGLIGYTEITSSTIGYTITHGKRMPGLMVAALLVITVIAGMSVLSFMSRLLLGGVVVYVGLALLYEWVIQSWSTFPKIDYAIIVSILLMIALKDLMWGIVLGFILTTILFVINYGRVNPIQIELSGATFRSRVNRGVQHNALLQAQGDQLLIFKLHGFIFFGSANRLFEQLRQSIITRNTSTPTHFVLLDFEHVRGVDSTSMLSFGRLLQFSRANSIELVLTGLTKHLRNQLSHSGFTEQTPNVRIFDDLDHGVEWCEDEIMASAGADDFIHLDLTQQLATLGLDANAITALIDKMQRREVNTGEHIIHQGDPPDELFLIESGQFTAQLEKAEREPIRLETMHGGCMVGELGFFLGTHRNASVVADCPSVVRVLSQADWAGIIKQDADAAQTLSSLTIYVLGRRVSHLTRAVDALMH